MRVSEHTERGEIEREPRTLRNLAFNLSANQRGMGEREEGENKEDKCAYCTCE